MRVGLVGIDSSHAEDFLRLFNGSPRFRDIRVTEIWGPDAPADRISELLKQSPSLHAPTTLDGLIASVDAVIVGDRHGDLHRAHALAAIGAGKPVFIDKPLANNLIDAVAIVDAADHAGVPLLSGSALRWQGNSTLLKARLAYVDGPVSIAAHGTWYPDSEYGSAIFYAIHTIELMQELIGARWQHLRVEPGPSPTVRYETGDISAAMTFRPLGESGSSDFGVSVRSRSLSVDQKIPLPDDYMLPVVNRIAEMLRVGKSGMDRDTLLAPIRMMEEIDALLR